MPALRSLSCNLRTTVSRSNDAVAEPGCSTVVLLFVTHTHPSKQVDGTPAVHASRVVQAHQRDLTKRSDISCMTSPRLRAWGDDSRQSRETSRAFVVGSRLMVAFAPLSPRLSPNDAGVSASRSAKAAASSSRNRRWLAWRDIA